VTEAPAPREAGIVSRFAALSIDVAILTVIGAAGTLVISHGSELLLVRTGLGQRWLPVVWPFVSLLIVGVYHVGFVALVGQTPGKWLLGLRVISARGGSLRPWQAVVRWMGYAVSAAPLCLGFLWVLFDRRRQAWHDKLARTLVVYAREPAHRETHVELRSAHR
jgi:uncharacterized RDD family membrane protein YckC